MVDVQVRELTALDSRLLEQFTNLAIWTPQVLPSTGEAHSNPALRKYWQHFGAVDDHGFLALSEDGAIGAAWARIIRGDPGYGRIDDRTPELAIAVVPTWRGRGVGTQLLETLLDHLTAVGYQSVSLSVQKANPAVHLYKRFGFVTVRVYDNDYVMVRSLAPIDDSAA